MADSEVGKCGRFSRCLSFDGFPRLCWKSACETVRCAMLASYQYGIYTSSSPIGCSVILLHESRDEARLSHRVRVVTWFLVETKEIHKRCSAFRRKTLRRFREAAKIKNWSTIEAVLALLVSIWLKQGVGLQQSRGKGATEPAYGTGDKRKGDELVVKESWRFFEAKTSC